MDSSVSFDQYAGRRVSVNYFESDRWVTGRLVRQVSLGEDLEFLLLLLENGSEFLVDLTHLIAVEVSPEAPRSLVRVVPSTPENP